MAKNVKRRWSTIVPCVVKLTGLSFVIAMSAFNLSAREPRLFRTYKTSKFQSPNCKIWEAARATTADPNFFEQIDIDGESFVDGGIGRNNPINQVLQETELMFADRHISCIISIGAGQLKQSVSLNHAGFNG